MAVCGLKSILNLVCHDKSASSANQADLFDFILPWENQVKQMSLYRERDSLQNWLFHCFDYKCSAVPENVVK